MLKRFLGLFLIVFGAGLISFFVWWSQAISPAANQPQDEQLFIIPQGWGVSRIAQKLKDAGLINSPLAFKIMVWQQGLSRKIQAGDFYLSPSQNLTQICQQLTHGTVEVKIVIPEGNRREQIALIIQKAFRKQGVEFNTSQFLNQTTNLEGYLFPDTYSINKDSSAKQIARKLALNFEKKYQEIDKQTSLNKNQLVTLASLIEREAKYDQDRALIAGVLIKRLKTGLPLQTDAAVQYAKASLNCSKLDLDCQWWPIVKPEDLQTINSPYNTYQNMGLPPTPISNPGLASLKAAANPQETEHLFYLSDRSGKIHYAETLAEHQKNIEKYLN